MSFGHIPPVPRLRQPARWENPWVASPWNDTAEGDSTSTQRRSRPGRRSIGEGDRGLILDLDDTLYPRERFLRSGFAAVARHVEAAHGIPAELAYLLMSRTYATEQRGQELQVMCDRAGLSRALVPSLLDVFRRHMPILWLNHGVSDALHMLRATGWRLGILTNGLPSVQFRKVAALELMSLVDEVVYAEDHVTGGKPAVAAFEAALRSLELSADQCICVGDDLVRDVRGARVLGMRTIRLSRPGVIAAPGADADVVIDSFRQLPDAARLLLDTVTADVA
ncbi:MAG TPA: HAD family hydrolase [Vicinamibacterales bacterium]